MAKRNNSIPQVPEEFRQQYKSEYACLPIKWRERFAPLPDEVAGRILKAVLEHCVTGSTNPPEGVDAFAFGFILDEVDAYQEKGLQFAWARAYKAQNAAQSRWAAGKDGEGRQEDAQGYSSIPKHSQECHNIISTSISTSTPTLKENTNTNNAREESRGDGGEGVSFSDGGRVPSLQEYLKYCREILLPYDFANSLWEEMEAVGWAYDKDGERKEVRIWKNFVQYRAKHSGVHPATLQEIESASDAILQEYRKNPEWVDINKFIYLFGREPNEYDCYQ